MEFPLLPSLPIGENQFLRPPGRDGLAQRKILRDVLSDETLQGEIAPTLPASGAGPLRKEFCVGSSWRQVEEIDRLEIVVNRKEIFMRPRIGGIRNGAQS